MIQKLYRDPDTVSSEIHDTQLIIMQVKDAIKEHPKDEALHFIIKQEEKQIELLSKELEEALVSKRRHVIKYMIDTDMSKFRLDRLYDLLGGFQELLNKAYQNARGKGKKPIPLYLNTTFKGSFGLMISTDSEDELIFNNQDNALQFVFDSIKDMKQFSSIRNNNISEKVLEKKMHDYLEKQFDGDADFINKFKEFYNGISKSGSDIKLEWLEYKKEPIYTRINYLDAKRYYSALQKKNITEEKGIEKHGTIKGMSLIKNELEFQITDKSSFKASFEAKMGSIVEDKFNTKITAIFNKTIKLHTMTDAEVETWRLVGFAQKD